MIAPQESGSVSGSPYAHPVTTHAVPQEDGNVLFDPYVGRAPPPPPKPAFAPAAIAAAILSLVPIASIAAIFVGIRGLSQTRLGTLRGRGLAIAAIVIGTVCTVGYGTAAGIIGMRYADKAHRDEARKDKRYERKQRERDEEERKRREEEKEREASKPPPAPAPSATAPRPASDGTVPQETAEGKIGAITVVDIGVKETSLKQALAREQKVAKAEGKEVLIMTTRQGCNPCAGVIKSLDDAKMQTALEKIRLVRVNLEVFSQELGELHYEIAKVPGFFLIDADGAPRDGINGGEWGEDIAANIAPVLGPFVRGQYKHRKERFKPVRPNGTFL